MFYTAQTNTVFSAKKTANPGLWSRLKAGWVPIEMRSGYLQGHINEVTLPGVVLLIKSLGLKQL